MQLLFTVFEKNQGIVTMLTDPLLPPRLCDEFCTLENNEPLQGGDIVDKFGSVPSQKDK